MSEDLYYIECPERESDLIAWWKPKRMGYTYRLNEAGKYSKWEAEEIVRLSMNEEKMHRCRDVEYLAFIAVFPFDLRELYIAGRVDG